MCKGVDHEQQTKCLKEGRPCVSLWMHAQLLPYVQASTVGNNQHVLYVNRAHHVLCNPSSHIQVLTSTQQIDSLQFEPSPCYFRVAWIRWIALSMYMLCITLV